jgi:hypothetical protein
LLRLCGLDAEDASAHLRWPVDTARRTAQIDALPIERETALNRAPRDGAPVLLQQARAAGEGGKADGLISVAQGRSPLIRQRRRRVQLTG